MGDFSQLVNKALGRNQETGGIAFWEHPERSGWLMKQGMASRDVIVLMEQHDCRKLVGAWSRERASLMPGPTLRPSAGELIKSWRRRCACAREAPPFPCSPDRHGN